MGKYSEPDRAFHIKGKSAGRYRFEKLKGSIVTYVGPWFDNLITDNGLAIMLNTDYLQNCYVGTGNTPPSFGDTSLQNRIVAPNPSATSNGTANPEPPYAAAMVRQFTWATGQVVGNVSEVGVGPGPGNLFSRALVQDQFGNPTTITVLADEQLRVTYEHRYFAPTEDTEFSLVLGGSIGGTYDVVGRASQVTTRAASTVGFGWGASYRQDETGGVNGNSVYNGPIGDITGRPSGSTATSGVYGNGVLINPLTVEFETSWSLTQGNISGGIRSIVKRMGNGMYQFEFSPPIPKDSSSSLSLVFQHSWGRR